MKLPETVFDPPFRVTRTSHVVMEVKDLAASTAFYTRVLGLVLTEQNGDRAYLRGIEEACHHSLVLKRADKPACARVGFRVYQEDDLDRAAKYFAARKCETAFVDAPHQSRTLHVTDPFGFLWEFCVRMDVVPRMLTDFQNYRGGAVLRLDHVQVLTPDVEAANTFYMALGFRCTEYIVNEAGMITATFLQRKGNTHDLVFVRSTGPRIHHFAFMTPDSHTLVHACDTAGQLGYGASVERGPGRHGPGHALYTYFRDPDGHRVELCNTTYQTIDPELEPTRWDRSGGQVIAEWGLPAQRVWYEEATPFAGATLTAPNPALKRLSLEQYLDKPREPSEQNRTV